MTFSTTMFRFAVLSAFAGVCGSCAPGSSVVVTRAALAQDPASSAVVEVQGVGKDTDTALKQALTAAVTEVVGTTVDAKTMIVNSKLVQEQIVVFSKGYVEKVETLSTKVDNGLTLVRVRATVRRSDIVAKINELRAQNLWVDGESMVTAAVSKDDMDAKRAEALAEVFERYIRSIAIEATVRQISDPILDGNKVKVTYRVALTRDPASIKQAYETLEAEVAKLADSVVTGADNKVIDQSWIRVVPRNSPRFDYGQYYHKYYLVGSSIQKACAGDARYSTLCATRNRDWMQVAVKAVFRDANGSSLASSVLLVADWGQYFGMFVEPGDHSGDVSRNVGICLPEDSAEPRKSQWLAEHGRASWGVTVLGEYMGDGSNRYPQNGWLKSWERNVDLVLAMDQFAQVRSASAEVLWLRSDGLIHCRDKFAK